MRRQTVDTSAGPISVELRLICLSLTGSAALLRRSRRPLYGRSPPGALAISSPSSGTPGPRSRRANLESDGKNREERSRHRSPSPVWASRCRGSKLIRSRGEEQATPTNSHLQFDLGCRGEWKSSAAPLPPPHLQEIRSWVKASPHPSESVRLPVAPLNVESFMFSTRRDHTVEKSASSSWINRQSH